MLEYDKFSLVIKKFSLRHLEITELYIFKLRNFC